MNISEIAKEAGVSKAAVSRYFNEGYLSPEKKDAIKAAVEKYNYSPNPKARNKLRKKTHQIGVVLPKLSSYSCSRVVEGIGDVLSKNEYQLLLANTSNNTEQEIEYLKTFKHSYVDGIIFVATIITREHKLLLSSMHIPVVTVGQKYGDFNCVYHDDYKAAYSLTNLMLKKGCKKPGFLGVTVQDKAAGYERQRGFTDALKDNNVKLQTKYMSIGDFSISSGYEQAKKVLSVSDRPDCLFCATDNIAIGAMKYCNENNIKIPDDLLMAGVGDSPLCEVSHVTLTSAHLHYKKSGEAAAQMMLSLLKKNKINTKCIKLDIDISLRNSSK